MVRKLWLPITLLIAAAGGCGQSNPTSPGQGSGNIQASNSNDTPDRAVFDFLEAVRTGNDQQAANMLTPAARQKTAEMQMVVSPPGSPTAKFKVGQVEYVTPNKDGAHVWCSWSDQVDGQNRTDDIIWVLRHENEGWRIAGMVTKVFPDQPPLVLNFEDPEDMLRKQQLLHGTEPENGQPEQQADQPQAGRSDMSAPATR